MITSVTRPGASNIGTCPTPSSTVSLWFGGQVLGEMPGEPGCGDDPVLFADHQMRRDGVLRELSQAVQQQRLDQQLQVGGAVRDVIDDDAQFALADPVRRRADRIGGQPAAERQAQHARPEQPSEHQQRNAQDELGDHLEFHRAPSRPAAGRGDAGDAARPPATLQFEGDPTAQRVADDVGGVPAQFVHLALDVIGQHRGGQEPGARRRPAVVAGHRRGEHLIAAGVGQLPGHLLPDRVRQQEGMQQQDRLSRTEVDRRATRHAPDITSGTAGTAS